MSTQFFPVAGCKESAAETQAALANSVLHLFKSSLVPNPSTPLSEYTAAEADYANYTPKTFAAWNDPILAPGTGYMIGSPLVQFETDDPFTGDPNTIGGAYLVDSGGKLRLTVIFTNPIPMQLAGQGIPINLVWLFPTGVTVT